MNGRARSEAGRSRTLRALVVFGAFVLWSPELAGQERNPLDAFVVEALRNNPVLAQERASVARAAAEVRAARGLMLPSLRLESRYSEQSGTLNLGDFVNPAYAALNDISGTQRYPTDLDLTLPLRHESRLRLSQPVFDERIRNGHAVARHRAEAQGWQRQAAARRLAAQVQTAWLEWAASRRVVGVLESALTLVTENERVTTRQVSAGTATAEAVFRARADRSEIEQQLAQAEETVAAAGREFNRLLGRSLGAPIEAVADSLLCFELTMSEDSALAVALARREELQQVRSSERAGNAAVPVATGSLLPSVVLALDYGFQGNELSFTGDSDFWVASLVVSWNLFDGGRNLAVRQQAKADVDRARAAQREVEDAIRTDVRNAYGRARSAQRAVQTAGERLQAARRTFELVRRRYEEGLASHIEFVDARTSLTSAELNRTVTEYRYFIHWVDLERAAALRVID